MTCQKNKKQFMQAAINLARHAIGNVGDNPAVGCIIVANGQVIGRGYTQKNGTHAEVMALVMAQKIAPNQIKHSEVFVTLEPCAHFGRTPPCANALVNAQVGKVYIAVEDPDKRVSGKGIAILKVHGIEVEIGLLETEAKHGMLGFLSRIKTNKPHVLLKLAMSQDGYIVRENGTSKWITCPQSRKYAHLLRSQSDAILIGIETALADDPMLDCRLNGLENRSPTRVVLDSELRIDLESKLVRTANKIPTMVMTGGNPNVIHKDKIAHLTSYGVMIQYVKRQGNHLDLTHVLRILADHGINQLMIEGGTKVASAFVTQNLVDALNIFFAPEVIGTGGKPAIENGIGKLLKSGKFIKTNEKAMDIDRLEVWQALNRNINIK